MDPEILSKTINSILSTAVFAILGIFGNFLVRKSDSTVFGFTLPTHSIHFILGPLLIFLNASLVVFLFALYASDISNEKIISIKSQQVWFILGPIFNPFYIGKFKLMNNIGYFFLIFTWWIGVHSFLYSVEQNSTHNILYGWQILFGITFLSLGLASMCGIQLCWYKWDFPSYKSKWIIGFIGIPVGAFIPPLLLRLGMPKIFLQ